MSRDAASYLFQISSPVNGTDGIGDCLDAGFLFGSLSNKIFSAVKIVGMTAFKPSSLNIIFAQFSYASWVA
jgi:hypothetical protein